MRVLHFFKTYHPDTVGGIENVICQLCCGCQPLGVESSVLTLTPGTPGTVVFKGHLVHRVRQNFYVASTGVSWSAFGKLTELARQHDIIHYHFPWPLMDLAHFVSRVKLPSVVTYHSDIVKQESLLKFYIPLMRRFFKSVHRIVATSPNYVETSPVLKQFRSKVEVVPIGVDRRDYAAPSEAVRDRMRRLGGGRFFLFVGLLRYYKGIHILLKALAGVDYPVVIAGSGPMEAELREQAAALGLKNVVFTGRISDEEKTALLEACYGFVFPSHLRSEAFGISLLEAAMMGRPMISCEIGTGTSYINRHGETGLTVAPDDPAALREAMTQLWRDPVLAERCGAAAARRYEEIFTGTKMAEGYTKIYQSLLRPGVPPACV